MQVNDETGTALCIARPVAVFGRIAVPLILKVVKLLAEWHFSQATLACAPSST